MPPPGICGVHYLEKAMKYPLSTLLDCSPNAYVINEYHKMCKAL